jgi:hypothetical protein
VEPDIAEPFVASTIGASGPTEQSVAAIEHAADTHTDSRDGRQSYVRAAREIVRQESFVFDDQARARAREIAGANLSAAIGVVPGGELHGAALLVGQVCTISLREPGWSLRPRLRPRPMP